VIFFYKGFTNNFLGLFFYLIGILYDEILLLLQARAISSVLEVYVLYFTILGKNTGYFMLVLHTLTCFLLFFFWEF